MERGDEKNEKSHSGRIKAFLIDDQDQGLRLDKLLTRHYSGCSRSYFHRLIDQDQVLINGLRTKKSAYPSLGDRVEILFEKRPLNAVQGENIPLDILYEDEHFILINKPADMVVHPGSGNPSGTLANALIYHCKGLDPSEFAPFRPGIVHRLDKETSGVIVTAKTLIAYQKLTAAFAQRKVEKKYLAICCGAPKEGPFSAPIQRHRSRRKEMDIDLGGKEATTLFQILAQHEGLSIVEAKPITGRTHQIRVHLKGLKAPILGDEVYGNRRLNSIYKAKRQMLHAQSITFDHPFLKRPIQASAPIPADVKNFIDLIQHS